MPESCTQSKFIVTRASPPSPEKEGRKLRVKLRLIHNTVLICKSSTRNYDFGSTNCGNCEGSFLY